MKNCKTLYTLIVLGILAIAVSFNFSCSNGNKSNNSTEWKEGGKVLVKCGDVKMTESEVESALLTVPAARRDSIKKNPERYADFAQRLLTLKLGSSKALEKKVHETDDFKMKLNELDAMYNLQVKVALQEAYIKKEVMDRIIITDKEAKTFYNSNLALWEKREVSEIFISVSPNATKKDIKTKESLAFKVYYELNDKKTPWNEAVKRYSNSSDLIKNRNGSKGLIHRNSRKFPNIIIVEAFKLNEVNSSTKPISTKKGFYIIKLDKKIQFEEQQEQIKRVLTNKRVRNDRQEFMDNLKTAPFEFFIEGYDPNQPLLKTRPKNGPGKPKIKNIEIKKGK